MISRDTFFYGMLHDGLSSVGFNNSATAFNMWVNNVFARKYNLKSYLGNLGVTLSSELPISATYSQFDVEVMPYTMAAYVDIDSDGPNKHTGGASAKMGNIPVFKHEVTLDRKTLREQAMLRERIGGSNDQFINSAIMGQLFTKTDMLLGGNYNTFAYQRHQIVSNMGRLVIDAKNNPAGIPLLLDFGVDEKHVYNDNPIYTVTSGGEVQQNETNAKKFLKFLKNVKRKAQDVDFCPAGHWEVNQKTWDEIVELPYFRYLYGVNLLPVGDDDSRTVTGALATEAVIKAFIEQQIGAPIKVIDAKGAVEKFDKTTGKITTEMLDAFNEGYMVYVPDGEIATGQFAAPFGMTTPGARDSYFDGGRTWLRQVFNDNTMTMVIKSEVSGLCVPNKTRWMYYVKVNGSVADLER